jgi:CRP/FNR family transcriptional regulator, polysaccharide utilization system transcription regulator
MKKIVLIEDNAEVRENTSDILGMAGYDVYTAENGKQGVDVIKTVYPDLVVCDIMMPELDGYGVLHIMNKDPKTSVIPFIFLTAKAEKTDLRKGMNLGADDYLTKPFEETELLDAIESRLKRNDLLKQEFSKDAKGLNDFLKEARKMEDLKKLSEKHNIRQYKKKDYVFLNGSEAKTLYFINSGQVKTFRTTDSGKELTTGLFKKGDFFGYTALIRDANHEESAVILEDAELTLIPRADFFALLFNNRDVSRKFIKMLSDDLADREDKMISMAYSSVRRRVARAILEFEKRFNENDDSSFSMKTSRENLASMAGTTTETLIRTLRDFKEEGLVDINGREISILDRKALTNMPE